MRAEHFQCPGCKLTCRIERGENRSAVSHSLPECEVWKKHKGKTMEFLMLAQLAVSAKELGRA